MCVSEEIIGEGPFRQQVLPLNQKVGFSLL